MNDDSIFNFVSGGVGGLAVDIVLFPLDTLKVRLQSTNGVSGRALYRGLYKGVSSTLVGSFPDAGIFFLTYEASKSWLSSFTTSKDNPLIHSVSSTIAECTACVVRVPMEQIRNQMQTGHHTSLGRAFVKNWIEPNGMSSKLSGAYRAYVPTVFRDVPFSFIQFPVYEALKLKWASRLNRELMPYESATCGAFAGSFAASITTPFDVCKTRLTIGVPSRLGTPYVTFVGTIRTIVSEDGYLALFSGIGPRMLWMGCGAFILFGTYEFMKSLFHRQRCRFDDEDVVKDDSCH